MQYYGGFGLGNEWLFFQRFLYSFGFLLNKYDIVGFDYGANLALESAYQKILNNQRVGKVILLSPILFYDYKQDFHHTSFSISNAQAQVLENNTEFFTHGDYERFFNTQCNQMESKVESKEIWEKFIEICCYHFHTNPQLYMQILAQQYGLMQITPKKHRIYVNHVYSFLYFYAQKDTKLRYLLQHKRIDVNKIAKKSHLFVTFFAENDRIISSKGVHDYFTQFGICYFLKNCNHLLMKFDIL